MNLVLWDILCHQFMPYSIINALGGLTVYIYCVQCKIVYICAWCHIIIIGILFISLFFFLDQGARIHENSGCVQNDDETFFHLKIPTPLYLNLNKLSFRTNLAEMPVYTHS